MYTLKVRDHFDSAHYIKDYPGKCAEMHGHRWDLEVGIRGDSLDRLNILTDFSLIKKDVKMLTGQLDHHVLNDCLEIENVTAEFLAKWFYDALAEIYEDALNHVTVWESPECSVTYNG